MPRGTKSLIQLALKPGTISICLHISIRELNDWVNSFVLCNINRGWGSCLFLLKLTQYTSATDPVLTASDCLIDQHKPLQSHAAGMCVAMVTKWLRWMCMRWFYRSVVRQQVGLLVQFLKSRSNQTESCHFTPSHVRLCDWLTAVASVQTNCPEHCWHPWNYLEKCPFWSQNLCCQSGEYIFFMCPYFLYVELCPYLQTSRAQQ